jgi:outer membrane protein assembly factor BamB
MSNIVAAVSVVLLLVVHFASAMKVDPIVWSTPLNDDNVSFQSSRWIATSASGAVIVVNGANLTSLDPHTGAILWSNTHKDINVTYAAFAVSSTAVVIGSGTTVTGFNLTNGALLGTAQVTGKKDNNQIDEGIETIIVHRELFVVYGLKALAVFGSDFTEHYAIEKTHPKIKVSSVGVSGEYMYFTAVDDWGNWSLRILSIENAFSEMIVDNIRQASPTGVDGYIMVMPPLEYKVAVSYLKLSTGAVLWTNANFTTQDDSFILFPTTDVAVIAAADAGVVYAFNVQTGAQQYQYVSELEYFDSPVVAEGRLVITGQSRAVQIIKFETVDLATGLRLGGTTVPSTDLPTTLVFGTNLIVMNPQGYTCVDIRSMTPVSHQLQIAGASAAAVAAVSVTSTTFVIAGLLGAFAVEISN